MAVDFCIFLCKKKLIVNKGEDLWFTGVKCQNLRDFSALISGDFIMLSVAGVLLFFGMYRSEMWIKIIIQRKV